MTNATSNAPTKADVLKTLTAIGADAGRGAQSRTAYCIELTRASAAGVITEKDAGECYAAYLRGKDKATTLLVDGHVSAAGNVTPARDGFRAFTESDTVQASKFNYFIKLGKVPASIVPFPVELLNTAGRMVAEIMAAPVPEGGKKPKIKTFESLMAVAKAQCGTAKKPRTTELTDDEIRAVILGQEKEKEESEPKSEKDLLNEAIKRLQSIENGKEDSEGNVTREAMPSKELANAIAWLEKRVSTITSEESDAKLMNLMIRAA
jgi:hypothetical protein